MKLTFNNQQNREPALGIGLGNTAGAAALGLINNGMQLAFGKQIQEQNLVGQRSALHNQNVAAYDLWQQTNYSAQVNEMKKAGINPGLIYGMSGGGATTAGSGSATAQTGATPQGLDIQGLAQLRLLEAQAANIEADTANKKQQTDVAKQEEIIKMIAGWKDNADYWDYWGNETDKEGFEYENPQRTARKATKLAELKGAEGVARNLAEQYRNGNLQKMSEAQLNDLLKGIGVKEGTITKLQLENALTEMEKNFLQNFNMGKDAKGWIDMGAKMLMYLLTKSRK